MTTPAHKNDIQILIWRNQGLSLPAIGNRLGVSRQRIDQILKQYGLRGKVKKEIEGISGLELKLHHLLNLKRNVVCPKHNRLKLFTVSHRGYFYCGRCTYDTSISTEERKAAKRAYEREYHRKHYIAKGYKGRPREKDILSEYLKRVVRANFKGKDSQIIKDFLRREAKNVQSRD